MALLFKWLGLQLFADGGDGGSAAGADGAAAAGENAGLDAGDARLRELGVPEHVLAKNRAKRAKATAAAQQQVQQPTVKQDASASAGSQNAAENAPADGSTAENNAAPSRMSWDEIMADPEYNKQMQATIQARLKASKGAEETLSKLAPAIELLARKHGLDAKNLDADALAKAISDDNSYYEEKAVEMGVPVETAKKIDQSEREAARKKAEEERTIEQQKIAAHIEKLRQQGEGMKATFPQFDLAAELRNPAFARMTSPNVGISVEDAYYAIHRKEIQAAAMQVTAQKTAQQMANAIRSGQSRPVENGTSAQAPSVTTFDYAHASKEQREALKRKIRDAAAKGQKLYPGQM